MSGIHGDMIGCIGKDITHIEIATINVIFAIAMTQIIVIMTISDGMIDRGTTMVITMDGIKTKKNTIGAMKVIIAIKKEKNQYYVQQSMYKLIGERLC